MTARTVLEMIGIVVGAILLWLVMQKPVTPRPGVVQQAQDAPAVSGEAKVPVTSAKVLAHTAGTKKKVKLPEAVKNDPAIAVLDSSAVAASDRDQTVTEVLNTATGETNAYVSTDPYPWLAGESDKRFSLAYGLKNRGAKVFRLQYSHELVQIKALHFGPVITLDTDGQGFAGLAGRW